MKKTLFLSAVAIISLGSCKKNDCWKCTTRETYEEGFQNSGAAAKFTECGKTEAEIRQLEKDRSGTEIIVGYSGATFTKTAVTTCK